ncbi:hypothetical protein A2U01_0001686 [Trifolium medium]|uniref:DUF7745 domain-containing protein n=1 Tax=Trifolium medium TaxID=97028 RepID=A0A392M0U1_9FABA|nr:hypothetical protein [Trifolium medium]
MPKKSSVVENLAEVKWSQELMALTERDISWYSREYADTEVILRCGEFPNVPLIGTRGYINYNHVLALRQLGYPMEDKPDDDMLEGFVLKKGVENPTLIRKIRKAWGEVIKLPFIITTPNRPLSPAPITTVPIEEADELKAKIAEFQGKNEELQLKHLQAVGEVARLKRDQEDKEKSLQKNRKRLRESEEKRKKIGEGLDSVEANLIAKKEELKRVEHSNKYLRNFGELASKAQKKWREKYQGQVQKVQELDKRYKELLQTENIQSQEFENLYFQERSKCERLQANVEAYEDRCGQLQASVEMYEEYFAQHARRHEDQIAQLKDELENTRTKLAQYENAFDITRRDAAFWRNGFRDLAALSNLVIAELPEKLRDAEAAMHYYILPKDVADFMEYCKDVLKQYREEIRNTKRRVSA